MIWDEIYTARKNIDNSLVSELAKILVSYLKENNFDKENFQMLDVGCGDGRDVIYFANILNCNITAIDSSLEAISVAIKKAEKYKIYNVKFKRNSFSELEDEKYDVVFASNFYYLLKKDERERFRDKIMCLLKPKGLLFINALSVKHLEGYKKSQAFGSKEKKADNVQYNNGGKNIQNIANEKVCVHLSTEDELKRDFNFLKIEKLYEYSYDTKNINGVLQKQVLWVLIGRL